jgi:uncharacterized protein YggE
MKARWVGVFVGGATVGLLAVAAAGWVGRDDPHQSLASPAPTGDTGSVIKSITVTGQGSIKVKPDTASLNIGVQATATTATKALAQANESAAALLAALKSAGISGDDITTSGLSIYPQYGTSGNVITSYQASNSVTVTVRDIAKTGPVVDAAAAAAGDSLTIGGVSFYVNDTEALIGAARAAAIDNAHKRASEYATAAGVGVGAVLQISEVSVSNPIPLSYKMAADSAGGAMPSTPVEPGTQDMSVTVTVVYGLT